jgi:hypothetical protein
MLAWRASSLSVSASATQGPAMSINANPVTRVRFITDSFFLLSSRLIVALLVSAYIQIKSERQGLYS